MSEADPKAVAWRLAADLARARSEGEVAAAVARAASLLSGAEAVRVWMIDSNRGYRFAGASPEEETPPERPPDAVVRTIIFGSASAGQAYDPFRSLLVVPLVAGRRPLGGIELLERRRAAGPFVAADAVGLNELLNAADAALLAKRAAASREAGHLEAVTRLTRLFDLNRSLAATLERDALGPVIVNHAGAAFEAQAAYLWLLDAAGDGLSVVAASGPAAEVVRRWQVKMGEGVAGQVAASGEATLFDEPGEIPGIEERPDRRVGLEIVSVMAAPITSEGGEVEGVIEVVNSEGNEPFAEGDLVLVREVAETAALALGNTRRLEAERRAGDLGALLSAAQELGASLDLHKVTFTLVHQTASVIRYHRAAVALHRGARVELAAVSGQTFVDETLPQMKRLRDLLAWAAGLDEGFYVVQEEDGTIDTPRPEAREKFRGYFEQTGSRSFLVVPLRDEEGRLGVFSLEATEPYAFSDRELEAAALLGVQAAAAIRNALLFEQIPMVRVFRPLARARRQFGQFSWRRRVAWIAAPALLAAALVLVPVPLRVAGEARVLPQWRLPVTAEVEGRVTEVFVREGDRVEPGQVIAVLNDADYRAGREEARARYQVALREQSRLRAGGQAAAAAVESARLEGLRADLDLWEGRLERTRIRSTVGGVVATPRVEETVGTRLAKGEVFCEVVDPARQEVEVAIPESDAGLLSPGMPVKVKLHAYPTESFRATCVRVGVVAAVQDDEHVFLVRARLSGPGPALRSGMTGRAKIDTGPASVVRVLLRKPARWIWSVIWGWIP